MSTDSKTRVVTTYRLREMKSRGEKISMLTAYDYSMARIVDAAGVDVVLVGDSAANVMAGFETTVPMTLDHMIYHARSVTRAVKRALVVVDMPFGTYQGNSREALASAVRIMKEAEADAVKLEGGEEILESVQRILCAGIPVMGHLGLTPQSIHKYGTYAVRPRNRPRPTSSSATLICSRKPAVSVWCSRRFRPCSERVFRRNWRFLRSASEPEEVPTDKCSSFTICWESTTSSPPVSCVATPIFIRR